MTIEGPARSAGAAAMSACSPVAVIGAGNVGCALAADLGLRGIEVRLFNRSPGRLAAIRAAGGITVTGETEGSAPLSLVTGSLEQAVDGAGMVAVTVPTASLPAYAAALARATSDEQLIWLNPGAHVSGPAAGPADGPPPNPEVRSEGYARHGGSARSAPSAAS